MKLNKAKFLVLSSVISMGLLGCAKFKLDQVKYDVTPEVLEVHGDSVEFTVKVNWPEKAGTNSGAVELKPFIKSDGGTRVDLPKEVIGGSKAVGKFTRTIDFKQGGSFSYNQKVPYQSNLAKSKLMVEVNFALKAKSESVEFTNFGDIELAEGMITTSLSVQNSDEVFLSADNYKPKLIDKSVPVYFAIDRSNFTPYFRIRNLDISNKNQIKQLEEVLEKDSTFVVKGIQINSYASPDGELERNENLSKNRSTSTFKYFKNKLKKLGYEEVNDSNFFLRHEISEDWEGLKKEVQASDLEDKAAIISIINNKSIAEDEREARIKQDHAKSFNKIKNDILPKLRRSVVAVKGIIPLKTDEELKTYYSNLDTLDMTELVHLGQITEDMGQKLTVYNHAAQAFPQDWRGYNNAAYVLIKQGKHTDALAKLQKANELAPNNSVVLNNMGVVYRVQKNYTKARNMFNKSGKSNYNQGLLAINVGNYNSATSKLAGKCDYNTALAYTLKNDYSKAMQTIDCINPDNKNASVYYLKAIVAARQNKIDDVTTNLTRSIQLDSNMRNKAKGDLEFKSYLKNELFINAIK